MTNGGALDGNTRVGGGVPVDVPDLCLHAVWMSDGLLAMPPCLM